MVHNAKNKYTYCIIRPYADDKQFYVQCNNACTACSKMIINNSQQCKSQTTLSGVLRPPANLSPCYHSRGAYQFKFPVYFKRHFNKFRHITSFQLAVYCTPSSIQVICELFLMQDVTVGSVPVTEMKPNFMISCPVVPSAQQLKCPGPMKFQEISSISIERFQSPVDFLELYIPCHINVQQQ